MTKVITVQLSQNALAGQRSALGWLQADSKLHEALSNLGAKVEPLHPGIDDSFLASFYIVEVSRNDAVNRVLDLLRKNNLVEAAYLKPADEAP